MHCMETIRQDRAHRSEDGLDRCRRGDDRSRSRPATPSSLTRVNMAPGTTRRQRLLLGGRAAIEGTNRFPWTDGFQRMQFSSFAWATGPPVTVTWLRAPPWTTRHRKTCWRSQSGLSGAASMTRSRQAQGRRVDPRGHSGGRASLSLAHSLSGSAGAAQLGFGRINPHRGRSGQQRDLQGLTLDSRTTWTTIVSACSGG